MKILIYYSLLAFHGIFCEHGFKDSSLKVVRMCPWEGLDALKKVTGCWVGILKGTPIILLCRPGSNTFLQHFPPAFTYTVGGIKIFPVLAKGFNTLSGDLFICILYYFFSSVYHLMKQKF